MQMEVTTDHAICARCGMMYGRYRGSFPASHAALYRGVGYLPYCKKCIEIMYSSYLEQCNNDPKAATRQMCRKLDLYWNDEIFDSVYKKNGDDNLITAYFNRINIPAYAGKSYDTTLEEKGTLWNFDINVPDPEKPVEPRTHGEDDDSDITDDIVAFWGSGYTPSMYRELEQRRQYWVSKIDGDASDIGTEAIIRQICNLEITIARDSASGKAIEKSVNALNTLLGSLNIKPAQKKEDSDSSYDTTPFGVWIHRWETQRPIPEPDPELKDVDGILKYILTWVYGHLAKMLGVKNIHSRMYEDEMDKLRVDHPEFSDEDDDEFLSDLFEDSEDDDYE